MGSEVLIGMASIPVIIALVAALRKILPRLADPPLATPLTVVAAIAWHAFFKWTGTQELVELPWNVLIGQSVIVGLSASGLYSGATAFIEAAKPPPEPTGTLGP